MRALLAIATLIAAAGPAGTATGEPQPAADRTASRGLPPFEARILPIEGSIKDRITPTSWRPGCPVPRRRLRLIRTLHVSFRGRAETGRLIVHATEVDEVKAVLRRLYNQRFPIRRMNLIDRYGGSDRRSMDADNTSAFNCRFVAGTTRWSEHAYGRAMDINPIENPYVNGTHVSPEAGRPYADRSRRAKGMIHRGDVVYRAFRRRGWEWGGDWQPIKDYQHFSANGN